MSWRRWQRVSGWLALVCAVLWAVKFTLLSIGTRQSPLAHALEPIALPLVAFIIPTLGSFLGLVFPFGLAAPLLTGKRLWIALPVSVITGIVAFFISLGAFTVVNNALAGSPDALLRAEGAVLVSSAWSLMAAYWLLRPRVGARWFAIALVAGGVLWLVKGAAVAAGAPLNGGWVIAGYQLGLWLLVATALVFIIDSVRQGRFARLAIGLALCVGAFALGAIPVLGGELGLMILAIAAVTAGVAQWTRLRAGPPAPQLPLPS